jgi:hypothetical protein
MEQEGIAFHFFFPDYTKFRCLLFPSPTLDKQAQLEASVCLLPFVSHTAVQEMALPPGPGNPVAFMTTN